MRRLLPWLILLAATTAQAGKIDQTYGPGGWSETLPGHEGTYYFFRGLDYGSQHLIHPLRLMGAQIWGRGGDSLAPLVIKGNPLRGIEYRLPGLVGPR